MAGLVAYASSDEESEQEEVQQPQPEDVPRIRDEPAGLPMEEEARESGPAPAPAQDVVIGPSRPAAADMAALPSLDDDAFMADTPSDSTYGNGGMSPYSAERAAVRELTMPRVPDFDIPGRGDDNTASSDGASEALSAALNKKFATFLELKQDKATHFNARLMKSYAMSNPALMDNLMVFIGLPGSPTGHDEAEDALKDTKKDVKRIDPEVAAAPYATTLPAAIWDPAAFPAEAYRRSLHRLHKEAAKQRARAPGQPVDFVSATAAVSAAPSSTATATASGKRKTRL